ncbi:MAG: alanine--tRNA ligase, partial [Clostridia bacterium]|nr:alanine--tRNA ligase [Clostridia bacterium]
QGVDNMFEVDTIRKVIDKVSEISGKKYGDDAENDISIRVVTDHSRSAMFMISDGVIPSNEGRGYVLRRIIRRACRHGKLLGIDHPFLVDTVTTSIEESKGAYRELDEKRDYILKVISLEEERFDATIDAGLSILSDLIRGAIAGKSDTISGEDVFKLYDTFGFPIDLTREIAAESKLSIDEKTFSELMLAQRKRAREARANIGGWDKSSKSLLSDLQKTEFTGYTEYESEAKVIAILTDAGSVESVSEGDCSIILDRTPFYGEGGGQVGDTGTLYADGFLAKVYDTKKTDGVYIHVCTVAEGSVSVGDTVTADIIDARREAICRNHSAAHLLQAALRQVLGNHVEQAGSYVNDEVCRFDFTHFAALTSDEIKAVEALVNANILVANDIVTMETDIETAKQHGAMALFGEKYGKTVRMVKMGKFSTELCGGTHCNNTGKIGLFKIISESSVAAGVRRIEAVTGLGVLRLIAEKDALIAETANELKVQKIADVAKRAAQIQGELHDAKKEIEALNAKLASSKLGDIMASAQSVGSVKLIAAKLGDMQLDAARALADDIKANNADAVAVLAVINGDKLNFIAAAGKDAVAAGAHAGKLVGAVAAVTGGKGGGRPDSAMAGGKEISKTDEALDAAKATLEGMLK